MTEEHANNIYTLISKYLAGEASSEEKAQVEAWAKSSDANRKEYEKLEKLWLFTSHSKQHDLNVNVDQAWEKLHKRMHGENYKINSIHAVSKNNGLFFYLSRIAAVFLLAVAIFFIYKLISERGFDQQETLYAHSNPRVENLSDSSTVTLNKRSQISFNNKFNKTQRFVELKGEAFFEVQSNPNKPFIVDVDAVQIIVLGTSFNIKAYDSLEFIQVAVQEGKVKVLAENDSIALTSGESASLNKKSGKLEKKERFNVNILFWKSEKLVFKNERLEKVFALLEHGYEIKLIVSDPNILNCRLTAKFEEESIDRIFEIIAANFDLKIERDQEKYTIEGEGCE